MDITVNDLAEGFVFMPFERAVTDGGGVSVVRSDDFTVLDVEATASSHHRSVGRVYLDGATSVQSFQLDRVAYIRGGQLYHIGLTAADDPTIMTPFSAESAAGDTCPDAAETIPVDLDSAGRDAWFFYQRPGTGGVCDDGNDEIYMARLSDGTGVAPTALPPDIQSEPHELRGPTSLAVVRFLAVTTSGSLNSYLTDFSNFDVLIPSGVTSVQVSDIGLLDQTVVVVNAKDMYFVSHDDAGLVTLSPLIYSSPGSFTFGGFGEPLHADPGFYYFIENNQAVQSGRILRVPVTGTGPGDVQLMHQTSDGVITQFELTGNKLVFQMQTQTPVSELRMIDKTDVHPSTPVVVDPNPSGGFDTFTSAGRIYVTGRGTGDVPRARVVGEDNVEVANFGDNSAWVGRRQVPQGSIASNFVTDATTTALVAEGFADFFTTGVAGGTLKAYDDAGGGTTVIHAFDAPGGADDRFVFAFPGAIAQIGLGASCGIASSECDVIAVEASASTPRYARITATPAIDEHLVGEEGEGGGGGPPLDSDGDGLSDDAEGSLGTNPNNPDTDGDGASDGAEVNTLGTNPLNPDTDGDGIPDGADPFPLTPNNAPTFANEPLTPSEVASNSGIGLATYEIQDLDDPSGTSVFVVDLTVSGPGAVTVRDDVVGGVGPGDILMNGSAIVTVTAPLQAINTTFAAAFGVIYNPVSPLFSGTSQLVVTADDQNNIDSGPGLTGVATTDLWVNHFRLEQLPALSDGLVVQGADDSAGERLAGGDFNGDGFDDFVMAARLATPAGRTNAGEVYVVFGTPAGFPTGLLLPGGLDGSNGFAVRGAVAGDELGHGVALAGDINGDGLDDLVVGAPRVDVIPGGSPEGRVYVFFGRSNPMPAAIDLQADGDPASVVLNGTGTPFLGTDLAYAGDVNGDGIGDLVIGASFGADTSSAAYVVFGRPVDLQVACDGVCYTVNVGTLDGSDGFVVPSAGANDFVGFSVAGAGDVNGDGFDDVVIGASDQGASNTGQAYVVLGGFGPFPASVTPASLNGSNGFVYSGTNASDFAGSAVSGVDINGDGYSDVVIGVPGGDILRSDAGTVAIVYGGGGGFNAAYDSSDLNGSAGFLITGATASGLAGISVANSGDVDGNGIDDLLIGAPEAVGSRGVSSLLFGEAIIWPATIDLALLDGVGGFHVDGFSPGERTGTAVSAGDLNGDGFADLYVGSDHTGGPGNAYAIYGGDLRRLPGLQLGGAADDVLDGFGSPVTLAGAQGSDQLFSSGGDNVLLGGSGNDQLLFDVADVRRVDGGSGFDRLKVFGNVDFTALNAGGAHYRRYLGFESLQLEGGNTVNLNLRDVLRMAGTGATLRIDQGGNSDALTSGEGWLLSRQLQMCPLEEFGFPGCGTQPYTEYVNGNVKLQVAQTDLDRSGIPVAFDWKVASLDNGGAQLTQHSSQPGLSGDGRYLVFVTTADVQGQPAAGSQPQVYRTDLQTGVTVMVSQFGGAAGNAPGSVQPVISQDGRFVAFHTDSSNLLAVPGNSTNQVLLWDATNPGSLVLVSDAGGGTPFFSTEPHVAISANGSQVAFLGDTQGTPMSAVGGFTTHAWIGGAGSTPVAVSLEQNGSQPLCDGNGTPTSCHDVTMSGDGRWVAWNTNQDNPGLGDTGGFSDIYLRDMSNRAVTLVTSGNADSEEPFISGDGRLLAFESDATNLTGGGDSNLAGDIFVYDINAPSIKRASTGPLGEQTQVGCGPCMGGSPFPDDAGQPVLSGDGRILVYTAVDNTLSPIAPFTYAPIVKVLGAPVGGELSGATFSAHMNLKRQGELGAGAFDLPAFHPALNFDGTQLAMDSAAEHVLREDINLAGDVFVAPNPLFVDGIAIDLLADSDGDGLTNHDELYNLGAGTNPLLADTDGDGLDDGAELAFGGNPGSYEAGVDSNPADPDSDDDDVGDEIEVATNSSPVAGNTVYRVDCAAALTGKDGSSWTDGGGSVGPFGSNADVIAAIGNGAAGSPVYVLYAAGTCGGGLGLASATFRTQIVFVGSVGAGIYQPAEPLTTAFTNNPGNPVVSVSNADSLTFGGLEIHGGSAATGAGLLVSDTNGAVTNLALHGMSIHDNAAANGGGIAVIGSGAGASLEVNDTKIFANDVSASVLGSGRGGGIFAGGAASVTVNQSFLHDNSATNTFGPDPTHGGGGLYGENGVNIFVDDSVFADNKASNGPGGGMNLMGAGQASVKDSMFLSNVATRPGGGFHMHVDGGTSFFVFNNLVVGNVATDATAHGAGIEFEHNAPAPLTVSSNTVAYNQSTAATAPNGGGLTIFPATGPPGPEFRNNIVAFNNDADPAVEAQDNAVVATPSVRAGNNVLETGFAGNAAAIPNGADPLFELGFYLDPIAPSPSVDSGDGLASDANNFPAGFYTTAGQAATDTGTVDSGFHHRQGSNPAVSGVSASATPSTAGCPSGTVFLTPQASGGPLGHGHLVVAASISGPGTPALSGNTSLQPQGAGSNLAVDEGTGSYRLGLSGSSSGTYSADVYVDGLGPFTATFFCGP